MSYSYYDEVQRAYNDLKAEGKIQRRSSQAEIEKDKGLLTQRSAWYVNQERDARIGVMEKQDGNHYVAADGHRYSVDWHVRVTDGEGWDVATDHWDESTQTGEAAPSNGGPHGPNPDNIPRWRPATAQNAQVPAPAPEPEPEPEPIPDASLQQILDAITASETRVQANVTAQGEETRALIERYADQVDQWAGIILAAWFLLSRRPEDPPIGAAVLRQSVRGALLAARQGEDTTP